jgi:hypothetical protein
MARKSVCCVALALLACMVPMLAADAPKLPNPRWRVKVIIYAKVQMKWTDGMGAHDVNTEMTPSEINRAVTSSQRFFDVDVPALNSRQMLPLVTIEVKSSPLVRLEAPNCFWPDPGSVMSDLEPARYDSSVIIWKDDGFDFMQGRNVSLACYGGLAWPRGTSQTYASFLLKMLPGDQRNVLKHEWGHSILFYYNDAGTSPLPSVDNHINDSSTRYVSCHSAQPYLLFDETDWNPVANSIYNNQSGFTHDYYSGLTATPDQPDRCLGLPPATWATGGPVSRPIKNPGDLNGDLKVDQTDLDLLRGGIGSLTQPSDPRDLDYDGRITILDARRLVTFCTKLNCLR